MMHKYAGFAIALLLFVTLVAHTWAAPATRPSHNLAPTYRIFATREGLVGYVTANGHIIQENDHFVALPSWKVLSSYQGYEYQVRVTYNGRSVVAPVWDVGPWNTNDNYWSPNRGDYPDLPIGIPQAQAAYYDGHNGGRDEFGRLINNPNGIDLADGTFYGLGLTNNDWVEVSFLWLGEDPGPGAAVQAPIPAPPVPANPAQAPEPAPASPQEPAPPQQQPDTVVDAPAPDPTPYALDSPSIEVGAVAVDNDDSGYYHGDGEWNTFVCGLNGDHTWAYGQPGGGQRASWLPTLSDGVYEVKVYIPGCGEGQATRAGRYTILHDGGETEVIVDQAAMAGRWASLGTYHFGRETSPMVELQTTTSSQGSVVQFDAVAWVPDNDIVPPQAAMQSIVREMNGYRVAWDGTDDVSGIAGYDVQVRQLPSGGWRNWVRNRDVTSAWFGPDEGKHFEFRVRARDYVDNEQPWPETGMDTTQVDN